MKCEKCKSSTFGAALYKISADMPALRGPSATAGLLVRFVSL